MENKIKLTVEVCGHCFSRITEHDIYIDRLCSVFGEIQVWFSAFTRENDESIKFTVICEEKDFPKITSLLEEHLSVISYSWKVLEEQND